MCDGQELLLSLLSEGSDTVALLEEMDNTFDISFSHTGPDRCKIVADIENGPTVGIELEKNYKNQNREQDSIVMTFTVVAIEKSLRADLEKSLEKLQEGVSRIKEALQDRVKVFPHFGTRPR